MFQWLYNWFHAKNDSDSTVPKTDIMNWDGFLTDDYIRTVDSVDMDNRKKEGKLCEYLEREGKHFYHCPNRQKQGLTKLPTAETQKIYEQRINKEDFYTFCTEDFQSCPHYIAAEKVGKCS